MRFAVEVVRAVRERAGADFIIIFRLSSWIWWKAAGRLTRPSSWRRRLEAAGATLISHRDWLARRVSRLSPRRYRARHSWVTRKLKGKVSVPLVTTNRINDPQVADDVISRGDADMVSMASVHSQMRTAFQSAKRAWRRSTPASAVIRPVWIRSSSGK